MSNSSSSTEDIKDTPVRKLRNRKAKVPKIARKRKSKIKSPIIVSETEEENENQLEPSAEEMHITMEEIIEPIILNEKNNSIETIPLVLSINDKLKLFIQEMIHNPNYLKNPLTCTEIQRKYQFTLSSFWTRQIFLQWYNLGLLSNFNILAHFNQDETFVWLPNPYITMPDISTGTPLLLREWMKLYKLSSDEEDIFKEMELETIINDNEMIYALYWLFIAQTCVQMYKHVTLEHSCNQFLSLWNLLMDAIALCLYDDDTLQEKRIRVCCFSVVDYLLCLSNAMMKLIQSKDSLLTAYIVHPNTQLQQQDLILIVHRNEKPNFMNSDESSEYLSEEFTEDEVQEQIQEDSELKPEVINSPITNDKSNLDRWIQTTSRTSTLHSHNFNPIKIDRNSYSSSMNKGRIMNTTTTKKEKVVYHFGVAEND